MAVQTKGKCKYCGKEYTRGGMLKHLAACKVRKEKLAAEKGRKKCGYFELVIYGRYEKEYWLIIEMREDATLWDLDNFLRDIWLECCGHLSAFEINGESYEAYPDDSDDMWDDEPALDMNVQLKKVLQVGMYFLYEYDFGDTTELVIDVHDYWKAEKREEEVTILSRNNPITFMCDNCHEKPAAYICVECAYDGEGFLCEECSKTHECGEDMLLSVCNSPRMGVCAYDGSSIYPDQFQPDTEMEIE